MLAPLAAFVLLALTSCGSITLDQLQDESRSRGGGIKQRLLLDAVHALESQVGADELDLRAIRLHASMVTFEVVSDGEPVSYTYHGARVSGGEGLSDPRSAEAILEADDLPHDAPSFQPEDVRLDRVDAMVETAFERADLAAGYVNYVEIGVPEGADGPLVRVRLKDNENPPPNVDVFFDADGAWLETEVQQR